jgi:AraC family transcriptional regulator
MLPPILARLLPTQRLVFASDLVCAGTFACRADDPLFRGGEPAASNCIVFSRTPVWIQHEGGVRYVADPTVITFHARGRPYRRWRVADHPDRCDWVAFADDVVHDVVERWDPERADSSRAAPFRFQFAPAAAQLYVRQRQLFDRLLAGRADRLNVEEETLALLRGAMARAHADRTIRGGSHERRCFDAVQHVRQLIAAQPSRPHSLRSLSAQVALSPYQLCRAFSRATGETMTAYRHRLRLLSSLEPVTSGQDLTAVALDLGFSSHSHFTAAFRRTFGDTPSSYRRVARSRSLKR